MAQAVSRWPLTADARVRSRVSPCDICCGQSGTVTGFSPSTSVFACQYHSTNAPYSSLSACCSYQKDKRAKPALSEMREDWIERYFQLPFKRFTRLSDVSITHLCVSGDCENKQI